MRHAPPRQLVLGGIIASLAVLVLVTVILMLPRLLPETLPATDAPEGTPPVAHGAPLYMTAMTHMEGKFKDDVDEGLFNRHIAQLSWGMDLFDEYGGKMTVESEQSFAKANTNWNRNVLKEIVDRGHGVGTHADFGAETTPKNIQFYIRAFKENKKLVDDLVGAKNNKGISGGIGAYDWVTAMTEAGFSYVDGVVGFAYLSMPLSERPDGWTDEYIRTTAYHNPAPTDFVSRITMYRLADASNFTPDADGVLAISGGELGELASLDEGRNACRPNCALTTDDIDVIFDAILKAHAQRDPNAVAKLNVHIPLTLYDTENEDVFRYFLSGLESYAAQGLITWATQREAYEGYAAQ